MTECMTLELGVGVRLEIKSGVISTEPGARQDLTGSGCKEQKRHLSFGHFCI